MTDGANLVDTHLAEWIAAHAGIEGAEVHSDGDIVWMVQSGAAWSNAGAALDFRGETVDARLDQIVARYRADGRGAGFWVGPDARPADVEKRLRARGFRCRKRFAGMLRALTDLPTRAAGPRGLRIEPVTDHAIFVHSPHGHPYFGPVTTKIRQFELARLAQLTRLRPRRTLELVAILDDLPVGACSVHLGRKAAGLHDVGVLESQRNQGIGAALVIEACRFARAQGRAVAVLIASGMGESVYRKVGFREVCKMAFWYQSFSR